MMDLEHRKTKLEPGISQLKEKWEEYRQPRVSKKRASLFVSPTGEYVAVATGNRITILQKDDNYMEPCGIFTSKDKLTTFVCGAWSEARGILGVIDDKNALYFIRTDGNEIKKATRSQLKISESIIGLFVQDDLNAKGPFLYGFCIVTSDGLFYNVEIIDDPSSSITCSPLRMNFLTGKEQFLQNASCLDFLSEVSCLVLVSNIVGGPKGTGDTPGLYSLSLWHRTGRSELELRFCSPHFEGLFSIPKGNLGPITTPRVTISPDGNHVAALDLCGNLNVFNVDGQQSALSLLTFDEQSYSQLGSTLARGKRQGIINIVDVTWWSDHILMVARRSGIISMLDVSSDVKLLEDIPVSSIPILESVKLSQGNVFLLLDTLSEESLSVPSRHMESMNIHDTGTYYEEISEQDDVNKHWRLMSFLERSVSEMYMVLIRNQQYQPALEFADHHGMDRDEVFKSQWLLSAQGAEEADMFLSNIKDHNFVLSECIEKVGPTEDAVRTLLTYGLHVTEQYQFSELETEETNIVWDLRIARLQLLQCRDRLETFVGINMGRFSVQGYSKFRVSPLSEAAIALAESGKLGALNLLFKRHPYTLAPSILDILSAIPETVPVQSYGQLLPGMIPPNTGFLRGGDWVEYFACRGGITEMQQFRDDIFYLHQLIYSDGCDDEIHFNMSLTMWEQLSEYDKFKAILDEATEDTVMARLREKALPFMRNCLHARASACDAQMTEQQHFVDCERGDSFLSRWLKEITAENKLDICFKIIEDGCTDLGSDGIFQDEVESVDLTLDCIYLCTATDRWNAMSLLLSKLSEFKQIRNPMEIINMAITSQTGAYLDVDELIVIAKLLGLNSEDDIAAVQESVAREAAVTGCWDILLKDNVKFLSFAGLQLPWLLELSQKAEFGKKEITAANSPVKHQQVSTRMQAVVTIISWLANNDVAPSDDVMSSLAKSVMEPPVTEEEDVLGCSFLLNLMDAFHGVEVIEDQLRTRAAYQEICSIMNIGMIYSSLHHKSIEYSSPSERRELLLHKFQEKHASLMSEEMDQIGKAQSTFWKEWKTKLEEQIRSADQARSLEKIIPGVNTARFLSGDVDYIKTVVWSFIDSVKLEKKFILKEAVNLADAYGLLRNEMGLVIWSGLDISIEVLMQFLGCALVSELWANDDILAEILDYKGNILACASGVINMIFTNVYPAVGGNNKHRLSFIYGSLLNEDGWLDCILLLLDLWIKFADDIQEFLGHSGQEDKSIRLNADSLSKSLRIFRKLIVENEVSVNHGWNTVCGYMKVNPNGSFKMGASSFCVAMIYSGCGFQATSEVFSAIDTQALTGLNFSNVNKNLSDLYVNTEGMLLSNLCAGSADHRHLHQLLSSLSKFEGKIDDLNVVRHAVWGRLAALSNDMQLPSLARMHVLELMQSITGKMLKAPLLNLFLISTHGKGISPNIEINPEDLTTLESAVSCFLRLSRAVDSESQLVNLQGILEEWEGLFTEGMDKEKLGGADSPAEAKSWSDDEWDVGWDSFQEGVEKQEGKDDSVSIHPLHTCWMEIITKLVALSQLPAVIKLIDRSLSKRSVILLSEDEVHSLCKITIGIDCFTALKVMLLFPYKGIWFQCLAAVEAQLKHDGVPEKINDDHELLVLFLSSGVLSAVANDPAYSAVFSYFCYLVGRLSRTCQEDFLQHNVTNRMVSFGQVIIPFFVSELVNAGQYFLAGLIVSRMMCAHVSLSLINIAEACLIRYLEGQIRAQQGRGSDVKDMDVCGSLLNTVSGLRGRLDNLLQSALSSFSANVG
ncbi:hypothetical protein QJS10_CPB04g01968 [Acorus calamus]|uniref:KNTC1 first ARM-repeats domain-containing protein n=1 Tax=Acorus calamus TaxID=4465 RepID=A0AAV9F045_ACOCL|nr:hypothetical protein QJS10_CPB04g01968 [Acorus calamus]